MKSIQQWALKKQIWFKKFGLKSPKFKISDIVLVVISKGMCMDDWMGGIGVITNQDSFGFSHSYRINFGPRKGERAWYPESSMTLVKRA